MAYTRHGHHIPGTTKDNPPESVARCGGMGLCPQCSRDAVQLKFKEPEPRPIYEEVMGEETMDQAGAPKDIGLEARLIVREVILESVRESGDRIPQLHELFVVWSCKTLQHWKALVGRTDNSAYYEVTHNGDKNETYVDAYSKAYNVVVKN